MRKNKVNIYHPHWEINDNLAPNGTTLDFSGWWPYKTGDNGPVIGQMSEGVRDYVAGRQRVDYMHDVTKNLVAMGYTSRSAISLIKTFIKN
jgi:hypothetical protein